ALFSAMGMSTSFVRQYIPTIQEMPNSYELISDQYDVLYGRLPSFKEEDYKEMVLVVDDYNGLSDITLALLGYLSVDIVDKPDGGVEVLFSSDGNISIEDAVGKEIYLAKNDQMYIKYNDEYLINYLASTLQNNMEKLEIVGIVREKQNVDGILKAGFAYTPTLTNKELNDNAESEIVKDTT
ncbi:MAG: hypothetical protein MJ072_05360, partial [Clostridia bacterium]|nr:hypothetical protein [Clostridia bacterium]